MHPSSIRGWIDLHMMFLIAFAALLPHFSVAAEEQRERRFLYVATPGIRNDLKYGGHGVLVFDIDDGHKFVRRIRSSGFKENNQPDNVKGICASVSLQRLYVSTIGELISFDLTTDAIVWEKNTMAVAIAWPSRQTAKSSISRASSVITGTCSTSRPAT